MEQIDSFKKEADELVIRFSEYDIDVHGKLKLNEPKVNGIHRAVICLKEKIKIIKKVARSGVSHSTGKVYYEEKAHIELKSLQNQIEYLKQLEK